MSTQYIHTMSIQYVLNSKYNIMSIPYILYVHIMPIHIMSIQYIQYYVYTVLCP